MKRGRRHKHHRHQRIVSNIHLRCAREHLTLARRDALAKGHHLGKFTADGEVFTASCADCQDTAICTENGWGGELYLNRCCGNLSLEALKSTAIARAHAMGHGRGWWKMNLDYPSPLPMWVCWDCNLEVTVSHAVGKRLFGDALEKRCHLLSIPS